MKHRQLLAAPLRGVETVVLRLLVLSLAIVGCQKTQEQQSPSSRSATNPTPPLSTEAQSTLKFDEACPQCEFAPEVVIVSEAQFLAALQPGQSATEGVARRFGAELVAVANDQSTLGVLGSPTGQNWSGQVFVVARDFAEVNGFIETRDFYIAVVDLFVEGPIGVVPSFAFSTSSYAKPGCANSKLNGCRPLTTEPTGVDSSHTWATSDKGAGVPADVVMNAERGPSEANASGRRPELRLYWPEGSGAMNRFTCHGVVQTGECDFSQSRVPVAEEGGYHVALESQGGVALIREADLLQLMSTGGPSPADFAIDAVTFATAANLPEAVGVFADRVEETDVEVHTLIVARNLGIDGAGRLQATEFFVMPRFVRGWLPLFGTNVNMAFKIPMTRLPTLRGPCGMVSSFKDYGYCGPLECPPGTSLYANPRFGEERWASGDTRTTLRIPGVESSDTRVTVYACNEFHPPPPLSSVCRNQSESCNGEDDNCNGAVDEGNVCEVGCVP